MNHRLLSSAAPPVAPLLRHWLRQPVGRGRWRRWRRILAGVYLLAALTGLRNYFPLFSPPSIVGLLALLYMPALEKHPPERFRFAWTAWAAILLFFFLPVKTMFYAALCFGAGLLLETFYFRVVASVLLIPALLSPVTAFFIDNFSFPVRIQLTALAGRLVTLAGMPTTISGTTITVRDHAFSVDHACDGLHMLQISLLAALLLINYYQTQFRRRLATIPILLLMVTAVLFNAVTNLFRIICLVVLSIGPANPLHHLLGLFFLLVYIFLPLMPVIRWTIRRWGIPPAEGSTRPARIRTLLIANIATASAILLLIALRSCPAKTKPGSDRDRTSGIHPGAGHEEPIPGYHLKERENDVLQLDNSRSLVYIKPIPGFYYTDHTPTICWQGSGYAFNSVEASVVAGTPIFTAVMEWEHPSAPDSGKPRLYTAWWYDNGIRQSIQPFDWRLDLIRGAPAYAVVNVTASTPGDLHTELIHILQDHPFRSLLGKAPKPARVKIW
jgi:exosortase N